MIYITAEMKGLDFETWQDAFHCALPGFVLGDPRLDDLPECDKMFLGLEYHHRLAGEPKVQNTRGVGNWNRPDFAIIGQKLGVRLKVKESPFWDHDPKYRRVRAFSNDRQFLWVLLNREDNWDKLSKFYVTTYEKDHLAISNFRDELAEVAPKNILCFDKEVFIQLIELRPKCKIRLIEKPSKSDWRVFYDQTREYLGIPR